VKKKKLILFILGIIFCVLIIICCVFFSLIVIFVKLNSDNTDVLWGYSYTNIELPNDYRLYDFSREQKYIRKYSKIENENSGRFISSSVLKIDFNKRYVLALQYAYCSISNIKDEKNFKIEENKVQYCKVKLKSGNYVTYDDSIREKKHNFYARNGIEISYYDENGKEMKDYIDYNQKYYWILDTKEDILYGPYESKKEYIAKKKELGIENLKLKKLNHFKHVNGN